MRAALLMGAALLLAGCVNMSGLDGESRYACAAPDGVACDSVAGTYANALHHNLPSQRAAAPAGGSRATLPADAASGTAPTAPAAPLRPVLNGALPAVAAPGNDAGAGAPLRSPPRVLRLWTKPWEDADGDLWDQGYVYVQVDGGRWQLDHVQQRIRDRYVPLQPPPNLPITAPPGAGAKDAPPADAEPLGASLPDSLSRNGPSSPFGNFPALPRLPGLHGQPGTRQP